jgi:hypothetical protein
VTAKYRPKMDRKLRYKIYQISYNASTQQSNDPDFLPLDNMSNERPDWSEYWPIRNYLKSVELEENTYYGFLSPKFNAKTGLTSEQLYGFLESSDQDIVSFSPFFDQMAFPISIFEQAEMNHAGIFQHLQDAVQFLEPGTQLENLVMTSQNTIFCNYFCAKKHVWQEWLRQCEAIFDLCESNGTPLAVRLISGVTHETSQHPAKVFLIERMISYLLTRNSDWTVRNYNPASLPQSSSRVSKYRTELVYLDALKIAYCQTNRSEFLQSFHNLRVLIGKHMQQ